MMTTRYVLDELTGQEREEFEEHYFNCAECAADVRAAFAFAANARAVLRESPEPARNSLKFFRLPARTISSSDSGPHSS